MNDKEKLIEEINGLTEDFLKIASLLVEISGWSTMFNILHRIAENRDEGYIAGILQGAENFIEEKEME